MTNLAAVDLGASSGRVIVGVLARDRWALTEVHRFSHTPVRLMQAPPGQGAGEPTPLWHWDTLAIWRELCVGLATAAERFGLIDAVGIDSWGVDHGILAADGTLLVAPFSHRDPRTDAMPEQRRWMLSDEELYRRTGMPPRQSFNTVHQLLAARDWPGWQVADRLVMLPDLFGYWLTGQVGHELTNASTTGLVDPTTRSWSDLVMAVLADGFGLPLRRVLRSLIEPGAVLGEIHPDVVPGLRTSRGEATPVVMVASHDTASAVVGTPLTGDRNAFLSSGTWSLVGQELDQPVLSMESAQAGFSNELGVFGTVRHLRNVAGLWPLSESMRLWRQGDAAVDLATLLVRAAQEPAMRRVDLDDPVFLAPAQPGPASMPARINALLQATGQPPAETPAQVTRCILDSLAHAYAAALADAQRLTGRTVSQLTVVGGGVRNELLCQLTADACEVPVIAGPTEATAIGNLAVQACGLGLLPAELPALRAVQEEAEPRTYWPTG